MNYQQVVEMASKRRHKGKEGVPSASSLYRLDLCPGSFKASQGIKSRGSSYATQGTIDHLMQEIDNAPMDCPDDVYLRYWRAKEIKTHIVQEFGFSPMGSEIYFETDYLTGSVDAAFVKNNGIEEILLLDFKFGVEPTKAYLQLAAYAHLCFERYQERLKKVHVGIIQPQVSDKVEIKTWEKEEAAKVVLSVIKKTKEEPDNFHYGWDHCRYCPAFGSCSKTQFNLNTWI